ncbi:MAG: tetratricopeptide repeat protein [Amaricoccus sp.]
MSRLARVETMIRPDQRATDGGINVGGDARDVTIGYTIEQHEMALERREARVRADLERAHAAEKALLQRELEEIRRQMGDLQGSFENRRSELVEAQAAVDRLTGQVPTVRLDEAYRALGQGETAAADALFAQVEAMASATIDRAATAAFERGKLAETDIRWADAARHYATAARLAPNFPRLFKAREYAWRSGDYIGAFRLGEDLTEAAEAEHGVGSPQQAAALNEHALTLDALGRYAEAETLYRRAIDIAATNPAVPLSDAASWLNNLANLCRTTGRTYEAESLFRASLERTLELLGPDHPAYATRLSNLAGVLRTTGRGAEAETLYREALTIDGKALGEAHPDYATDLNNLAGLLCAMERFEEAAPLYRQALAIDERTLGPRHPLYAIDLNNYARLLVALGRFAEAEPLYSKALEIFERSMGSDHPDRARVLFNYAELVEATDRQGQAERLYREAIAVREKSLGGNDLDSARYLNKLAGLFFSMGRCAEADQTYREALSIAELGSDHGLYAVIVDNLATFLRAEGRLDEAEPLLRSALDIASRTYGPGSKVYCHALADLAQLLSSLGRDEEAGSLRIEARAIRKKMRPDN